jgi:hypothetical protein
MKLKNMKALLNRKNGKKKSYNLLPMEEIIRPTFYSETYVF